MPDGGLISVARRSPPRNFTEYATLAFVELQSRYYNGAGWDDSMWWQSANTIEVISNLALSAPRAVLPQASAIFEEVFKATSNDTIGRCDKGVNLTFSGYFDDEAWWGLGWLRAYQSTQDPKFLRRSRKIFEDLANRSWSNASCGGGLCWQATRNPDDMHTCYKNSITNELFLSLSAQLAAAYQERCARRTLARAGVGTVVSDCAASELTRDWAEAELDWFLGSGLINGSNLVNDGLDTFGAHPSVCLNNRRSAYTYNQGVVLSGLGALYKVRRRRRDGSALGRGGAGGASDAGAATVAKAAKADGARVAARAVAIAPAMPPATACQTQPRTVSADPDALLHVAAQIVEAVWASHLVWAASGGVLRENSEPLLHDGGTLADLYHGSPGTDGLMFKSVLLRHLRYLIDDVVSAHGGSETAAEHAIAAAGGNLTTWRARLAANAASIWDLAACAPPGSYVPGAALVVPPLFGFRWMGPCSWAFGGPTATTQTAAIDAFVSAAS